MEQIEIKDQNESNNKNLENSQEPLSVTLKRIEDKLDRNYNLTLGLVRGKLGKKVKQL